MSLQHVLILAGFLLILVGVFWPYITQLGLGRLPGDIVIEREHVRFYFPVVTCLLLSILLSLLVWFLRK